MTEASPRKRDDASALVVLVHRKKDAVDPSHMTPENFVERSDWTEVSLGYAREHGQCKLAWLLGAVKDEVEFKGALGALPPGEH